LRRKKGKTNWTSFWRVRTIRMSGAPCTMTTTTKTSCSVRRRCVFPASCTTRKLSRACHGGPRACGRKRKGVAPLFRLFLGQHPCKILVVTARPRASHQSAAICCPRGQRIGDHSNTTLGFGLCPSVITREACVDGASCVCHPKRRARSPVVSLSFSSLFFPTAGCGGSSHSHAPHIPGRPRYDGSLSGVDGRTALCERRRPTSVCRRRVCRIRASRRLRTSRLADSIASVSSVVAITPLDIPCKGHLLPTRVNKSPTWLRLASVEHARGRGGGLHRDDCFR
jgi:hypothetical protein